MTESAIATGGIEQVLGAAIGALVILGFLPAAMWTRVRVAAFFVLWQAFTPLRPMHIDVPLLLACIAFMEGAYRLATRRKSHPS